MTELNGRTVTYGYDDLYRLTSETIAGASTQNGTVSYEYDAVGNRKSLTSTVPAIPSGMMYYDANDRISTDQYDNNGNTVSSGGVGNVYDFENHLIQHGGITYGYDGDGNRVTKTVAGVTTKYIVTDANPTGYAQVLEEWTGSTFIPYTYGLNLLAQYNSSNPSKEKFYGYDGHGSVRYITNTSGTVTDTYDYDAFGNLLSRTGNTYNNYLFAGEQFDSDLGMYYNRARYLDVRTGRFWGMDSYEGDSQSPESLHRYTYASGNPINSVDPSGLLILDMIWGNRVHQELYRDFQLKTPGGITNRSIKTILGISAAWALVLPDIYTRPDLVDPGIGRPFGQVYEIKTRSSWATGAVQLGEYLDLMNFLGGGRVWVPGFSYEPKSEITLSGTAYAEIDQPRIGVITYEVFDTRFRPSAVANASIAMLFASMMLTLAALAGSGSYRYA